MINISKAFLREYVRFIGHIEWDNSHEKERRPNHGAVFDSDIPNHGACGAVEASIMRVLGFVQRATDSMLAASGRQRNV